MEKQKKKYIDPSQYITIKEETHSGYLPEKIYTDTLEHHILAENSFIIKKIDVDWDSWNVTCTFHGPSLYQKYNITPSKEFDIKKMQHFHSHEYYEMLIILDGTLDMIIENEHIACKTGEVLLMNRNIRHLEQNTSSKSIVYLSLTEDFLHSWPSFIEPLYNSKSAISNFINVNRLPSAQHTRAYLHLYPVSSQKSTNMLSNLIDNTLLNFQTKQAGSILSAYATLIQVFDLLSNRDYYHSQHINMENDEVSILANDIRRYIETNKRRLTREELAQHFNYNGDYLNRVFKKMYGISTMEYCKKIYLQEACFLLRNTTLDIHKISKQLGFTNRSQFYRRFTEKYDISPLEYREQYQK